MTTLTVGQGQQYRTIAAAVAASARGDTVEVRAGTYTNDFVSIRSDLTIRGVGGPVILNATVSPPNGKAIITEGAPGITVNLSGLTLTGAAVGDGNGAGIRYEGGTLNLSNMTVTGNQEGLLGAADPAGSINIANSTFSGNGSGTGYTHNIYVGVIAQFTLTGSTVADASVGHGVKSRAASNTITGNTITDVNGTASYLIDLPNGGNAVIRDNVIEKGPRAENPIAVSFGEEGGTYASNSLSITGNTFTNDFAGRNTIAVRNTLATTATVSGNKFYGWTTLTSGNANVSGNTVAAAPPVVVTPAPTTDPLFDAAFYLARNPAVATSGLDPYTHYMTVGWKQGLDPSPLFSTSFYLANNPDVRAAGINPLTHYETVGAKEGRNPDALFDDKFYLAQNPDVKASGANPLLHYLQTGWKEGRDPSLAFSGSAYLAANPDVKAAGLNPLASFLATGQAQGRLTFLTGGTARPDYLVDQAFYDRQLGATIIPGGLAGNAQAAASYDATGWRAGLNPNALFDTKRYLAANPDVAAAHINPLLHYEAFGWKEGRDPSAQFSGTKYLAANPDVRAAGFDPLLHYIVFGRNEGRAIFPA